MIIVGGEALIDLVVHPDGRVVASPGGGPYTTARTIGRLGVAVAFVGGISTDRFGQGLRDGLRADGVSVDFAVPTDAPTTLALAEIDAAGTAAYRFYTSDTSTTALGTDRLDTLGLPAPLGRSAGGGGPTVAALHVGTLGLVLEPLADAMEALVDRASDDMVVMVDPNCRPAASVDRSRDLDRLGRVIGRADVVKVSTDDLTWLRPGTSPDAAIGAILDAGPAVVLWTDGAAPVRVVTARGTMSIMPPDVRVVDTVGAGDAFGGGFLAAWIGSGLGRAELDADDALAAAAHHGVRVASLTCTRAGADPPTAAELAAWRPDR